MKNIPILILHGWNLSSIKFVNLQQELQKKEYKVYSIDLPGFGITERPNKSLFLSDYVKYVKDFLIKKRIKKVILIGHSFGGRISIKLAAQNSELLSALILSGVPGINPVPTFKILFFLILAKLGKFIFSLPIFSSAKDLFRKFLYKLANATDYYNTNDYMLETFKNTVNESLVPYMEQISAPTLLLWGAEDKMVPVEIAEKMNKLIKNSKLVVIDEARHGVPWTHSKEFTDEVGKFLRKI
ncbi:alpha/beta hydrolase [Candidatus Gottesmanbacteria bacterium]|nr:alpha/beta hydrolase [Candidatus Gottesmanbacteria bacterium]